MEWLNKMVIVRWLDSHLISDWTVVSRLTPKARTIASCGLVVYEDEEVVAVASTYDEENESDSMIASGIMVMPKSCIVEIKNVKSL